MNKNTTFSNVTQKIVLEDEVHIISEALVIMIPPES
ncbi:hypothetical protein J2S21_004389 [Peribacillus cavernae]|nr:hypothetical protein [Peribacillus cavernae]